MATLGLKLEQRSCSPIVSQVGGENIMNRCELAGNNSMFMNVLDTVVAVTLGSAEFGTYRLVKAR